MWLSDDIGRGSWAGLLTGEWLALLGVDDVESTSSAAAGVDAPLVRDGRTVASGAVKRRRVVAGNVYNSPNEYRGLGCGLGWAVAPILMDRGSGVMVNLFAVTEKWQRF